MLRRRRPLPRLVSLLSLACLAGVALGSEACGDIGLSTSSSPATTFSGGGNGGSNPGSAEDAGAASTSGNPGALPVGTTDAGSVDAQAAAATIGNPLCFYTYAVDAGGQRVCQPDTSNGCESDDVDAGVYNPWDSGVQEDGGAAPAQTACHVVASPTNGQACTRAGTSGDGAQCQTSADCLDSFECVGSPGVCRHYCCGGNASCDAANDQTTAATFCDVQPTASGGLNVPVCAPISNCALLSPCAVKGNTCAIVKDDGTTSCISIGPVGVGENCDVYHCAASLTCLGTPGSRSCFQLCEVDSPSACTSGTTCTTSAQLFTNANIGICQ